jgi:O-acetyl-ADP-ribose deacetylase (regulator of RNase III)
MRVEFGGKAIELAQGDITREETDAIVNAANPSLMGGSGVDGAIHRAGGPAILAGCQEHRRRLGGLLPEGEAVITTGGRLRAQHVIHTAGPVWEGGSHGEAEVLARCYRNALRLAEEHGLESLAFPSISTGVYGYPVDRAAPVALGAVREALAEARHVRLARFVLFDGATFAAYRDALAAPG